MIKRGVLERILGRKLLKEREIKGDFGGKTPKKRYRQAYIIYICMLFLRK